MDLQKTFKEAMDVALLKPVAMKKVADDKDMTISALVVLGAVALAYGFGHMLFPVTFYGMVVYRPGIDDVLLTAVTFFISTVAGLYVLGYLGQEFFKSKLKMDAFVRVMGVGSIVGLTYLVPALGIIGALWQFAIFWKLLKDQGKMETGSIVGLIILGAIAAIIIGTFVGPGMY